MASRQVLGRAWVAAAWDCRRAAASQVSTLDKVASRLRKQRASEREGLPQLTASSAVSLDQGRRKHYKEQ